MQTRRKSIHRLCCPVATLAIILTAVSVRATDWNVPGDFATIQDAINSSSVVNGDQILVGAGSYAGAVVNKSVTITGTEGAIINSGPLHPAGLVQGFRLVAGADGCSINHLAFTVDLAVFNSADGINDVTVSHCTFENPIQAITAWGGSRWDISHNTINDLRTRCGGGIGILIGDYNGRNIQDNVVAHNKITGTLHVSAGDCGGYNGTGIVLYSDSRFGRVGAASIAYNRVVKNSVGLASDTPTVVDVAAIELTDTSELVGVIHDDAIGFNDLRETALQIVLTPSGLDAENNISRNLGENRGHGLHPSAFAPGGN